MKSTSEKTHVLGLVSLFSWLIVIAIVAVIIVLSAYAVYFPRLPTNSHEHWGQFGDFFGGTLNPIFGFITIIALIATLALQARQLDIAQQQLENSKLELAATREELKKSADAQESTANALRVQAEYAAMGAKMNALRAAVRSRRIIHAEIEEGRYIEDESKVELALNQIREAEQALNDHINYILNFKPLDQPAHHPKKINPQPEP